jgi:arylsulfatase A-like enzyme
MLASLAVLVFAAVAAHAAKPNVVILYTDDQGTLDANCYGSTDLITPNIDRIAASGVRFTQAYAHTVCCPSRAALLTGRHPQRSGVNSWTQGNMKGADGVNMALDEVTIAEALKAGGYDTALFGKWHVGSHRDHGPMKQGFDEFFGIRNGFIDNYNHYFLHGKGYHDLYEGTTEVFKRDEYFPELITDRALQFIDKNKDEPFLLYLGFNIPHYPEQALKQHEALYKDMPMPRRAYAAIMTTTDHYVGQVLKKLDEHKLFDNTIVIFQSDNGHSTEAPHIRVDDHSSGLPKGHNYGANGGGGNTGKWIGHKGNFLEGGVRVPSIVSWPAKLPKGVVRDQPVTIMDWYPSILDWCEVERPKAKLDGRSLQPIIDSADAASAHPVIYFQWQSRWAVREGDWKLMSSGRNPTLHNLADAEPEVKNYATEKPDVVAALQARYDRWADDVFTAHTNPAAKRRNPATQIRAGKRPTAFDLQKSIPKALAIQGTHLDKATKAYSFDGKRSYIEVTQPVVPDPSGRALTVTAEFNAGAANGVILAQGGQTQGYALYLKGGQLCFAVRSGGKGSPVVVKKKLTVGKWVTVDATLAKTGDVSIRIDGKPAASGKSPGPLTGFPGDGLQIGADTISAVGDYAVPNYFTGQIRSVRITAE